MAVKIWRKKIREKKMEKIIESMAARYLSISETKFCNIPLVVVFISHNNNPWITQ